MKKVWVEEASQLAQLVQKCQDERLLAVDTEFIREKTFYPQVALIQVGSRDGVWLIDPLAFDATAMAPLLRLLVDPKILKVMHAAYGDQECFLHTYGIVAKPVLDTAVGAALLGMGDNIGLGRLTKEILKHELPKGRARAHWLERPLSPELIEYASADVHFLIELGDYFLKELDRRGRLEWALEESEILPDEIDEPGEDLALRVASGTNLDKFGQRILYHLVVWRENRARHRNLPRKWIAENEVLVSLARAKPQSLKDLRSFRGVPSVDKVGQEILDAIDEARTSEITFEKRSRGEAPTVAEENVLALLQSFISLKAGELAIAPRMLATASQLLPILRAEIRREVWANEQLLRPRVLDLLGADLESLLKGELVLAIQRGRVVLRKA